jgi:hypothetical protein
LVIQPTPQLKGYGGAMGAKISEQLSGIAPASWDMAMQLVPQLPANVQAAREVLTCMEFLLDLKHQKVAPPGHAGGKLRRSAGVQPVRLFGGNNS